MANVEKWHRKGITMETNVNYTLVGAFVILLTTAIALGIIWMSSGFSFENNVTYAVYMNESVSGLNIDSPVEYNGVSVGTVKKIDLNPENPQQVELLLNIKTSTPITMGTAATLNTRGVTGITFIALKDSSEDLRPLVALKGQPYPVIKTAPSLFMRLDTALNELSKDFHKISNSVQMLLDKDNQLSIKETLSNMQNFSRTLSQNSNKLNSILENTARASMQFGPLLQSSMGAMRMLENQTLPAVYQLLNNLDTTSRALADVSVEIKQNPSILIRGVERPTLGPGESR